MASTSSNATQIYFKGPCRLQNWSLPDSIIYYITKNPSSSKLYPKVIISCKYFFYKNPIIVCCMLTYLPRQSGSTKIDFWEISDKADKKIIYFKNASTKLWITDTVDTGFGNIKPNAMSSIVPYIYQCDAKFLKLQQQNITFNEYIFLASKSERICFFKMTVCNENGIIVPLEKLVEVAANVKNIKLYLKDNDISITAGTVKNLLKIPHFVNFITFDINNVPQSFIIETFYNYVKTNKQTYFALRFSRSISDAFKNRHDQTIDEILGTENLDYIPPSFAFRGMNLQKIYNLNRLAFISI